MGLSCLFQQEKQRTLPHLFLLSCLPFFWTCLFTVLQTQYLICRISARHWSNHKVRYDSNSWQISYNLLLCRSFHGPSILLRPYAPVFGFDFASYKSSNSTPVSPEIRMKKRKSVVDVVSEIFIELSWMVYHSSLSRDNILNIRLQQVASSNRCSSWYFFSVDYLASYYLARFVVAGCISWFQWWSYILLWDRRHWHIE